MIKTNDHVHSFKPRSGALRIFGRIRQILRSLDPDDHPEVGNEIDEDLDALLAVALEAAPKRTPLIDPTSGHLFIINAIPTNKLQFWLIDRYERTSLDDALTDLNLGASISAVPHAEFVYGCGRIAVLHKTHRIKPGDGLPDVVDQPNLDPDQQRQLIQFLSQAGLTRVSNGEIQQLVIQLDRLQLLRP